MHVISSKHISEEMASNNPAVNGEGEDIVFKVCLVGSMNVGKTALVTRSMDNAFIAREKSTVGVHWRQKVVLWQGRTVTLQLWDTAGQDRFASLSPLYCRKAHAVLLCYDTRNLDSFKKLDALIEKAKVPLMAELVLVGTKADLPNPAAVTTEEVREKALALREGGVRFFETSARTGANVDAVFDYVVTTLLSAYAPILPDNTVNLEQPPPEGGCCSRS